jgi:hypothetical protein
MNSFVLPLGGVLFGRIEWPLDGPVVALVLLSTFAFLIVALAREMRSSTPTASLPAVRMPRLPRRVQEQQAA